MGQHQKKCTVIKSNLMWSKGHKYVQNSDNLTVEIVCNGYDDPWWLKQEVPFKQSFFCL